MGYRGRCECQRVCAGGRRAKDALDGPSAFIKAVTEMITVGLSVKKFIELCFIGDKECSTRCANRITYSLGWAPDHGVGSSGGKGCQKLHNHRLSGVR